MDTSGSWKAEPPYRRQEDFNPKYNAGCHCGRVRYQIGRDKPLSSKFCHCPDCQRLHGAPFQWAAIFHKDDINFTSGIDDLEFYSSSETNQDHSLPCKVYCRFCHTPLFDEGRRMVLLFPTLVRLSSEEKKEFYPSCHIFYSQRVVDVRDGKTKWSGMDNSSQVIEET